MSVGYKTIEEQVKQLNAIAEHMSNRHVAKKVIKIAQSKKSRRKMYDRMIQYAEKLSGANRSEVEIIAVNIRDGEPIGTV